MRKHLSIGPGSAIAFFFIIAGAAHSTDLEWDADETAGDPTGGTMIRLL